MGTRPLRKPLRRIFFAVSRRRASTASSTSDAGTWTVTRRSIWEVVSTETCMDDPLTDLSVLGKRERSEEHTSELQSRGHLVCRLLLVIPPPTPPPSPRSLHDALPIYPCGNH